MHQGISKIYVSSELYVFRSIHNPYLGQVKEKIFQEETSVCYSHHLLLQGPVWQQLLYIFSWKKILLYVRLLQPLNNYSPSLSKCLDLLCCLKIRIDTTSLSQNLSLLHMLRCILCFMPYVLSVQKIAAKNWSA